MDAMETMISLVSQWGVQRFVAGSIMEPILHDICHVLLDDIDQAIDRGIRLDQHPVKSPRNGSGLPVSAHWLARDLF